MLIYVFIVPILNQDKFVSVSVGEGRELVVVYGGALQRGVSGGGVAYGTLEDVEDRVVSLASSFGLVDFERDRIDDLTEFSTGTAFLY